jgi:hypothetical protein
MDLEEELLFSEQRLCFCFYQKRQLWSTRVIGSALTACVYALSLYTHTLPLSACVYTLSLSLCFCFYQKRHAPSNKLQCTGECSGDGRR